MSKNSYSELVILTINERMLRLLADQNRTQKALAEYIGVNERNVGLWKARGTDPPAKFVYKIAEFFGVSLKWLLTGDDHSSASFVNNGSVSGNLGPHTGTLIIQNGGERALSEECAELIRIYESLEIRDRIRLLKSAFEIADGSGDSDSGERGE